VADQPRPWPFGPHPGGDVTLDARNLRGIAHPVRVRILALLREEGPSTATRLAHRLGLNSGATSYHLRQLASYGFVVDDEGRRSGRERWWRSAHQATRAESSELMRGEAGELAETYLRSIAAYYTDAMQRAIDEWGTLPEPWRGVGTLSDFALRLTPGELQRLLEEILDLISRYRRHDVEDAPADSVDISVQLQAFPRPGVLSPGDRS
jgi:DNA-binding transcriptional ArsR family regulator